MKQPKMILRYGEPAPEKYEFSRFAAHGNAWESYSLPIANGYFGANIFGRTVTERVQISEPSLANPLYRPVNVQKNSGAALGGVNNFAEILITMNHDRISNYERSLSLDDACAYVSYEYKKVNYKRRAFTSYPDKILAVEFTADVPDSVTMDISVRIPFPGEFTVEAGDGLAKRGTVTVDADKFIIDGKMEYYGIEYGGILKVINHGGNLYSEKDRIRVERADSVVLLFTCDTNYELCEQTFLEEDPKKKLLGKTLCRENLHKITDTASALSVDELYDRHVKDYRELYDRASLCLSDEVEDEYTNELIAGYKEGKHSAYLETLLYQYGRYLLISASRSRLPASLQGIWNAYCDSPWSCGYWHNINIQMNYWQTGPANLAELFVPYINYAKSYMKLAKSHADNYIKAKFPENYTADGTNGWIVGTSASPFTISGYFGDSHSGPGTGAFTSLLFWDYFDYTRDMDFLREFAYPVIYDMSVFFCKSLIEKDGKYLIKESASPENKHNGLHYHTTGCAFDQQMVYENFKRTIEAAELLGIKDDFIEKLKTMLPHLDPVLLGDDGQVKEYREETTYGSIGDPTHRHISHLVGLYPATIINANTPEWIEGAKITLTGRGNKSTGWAVIHRLLLWARTKSGHKCRELIDSLLKNNINDNLWDTHPPFQIDGNYGYTAAVCEMLMQSHSEFIELIPSIPPEWKTGSFKGVVARGNFVVDCEWEDNKVTTVTVTSRSGGVMRIKLPSHLIPDDTSAQDGIVSVPMEIGQTVIFK